MAQKMAHAWTGACQTIGRAARTCAWQAERLWPWGAAGRRRTSDDHYEERQWHLRWFAILGHRIDETKMPVLRDSWQPPAHEDPTFTTVLFQMRCGTEFKDFADTAASVAVAMGSQRAVIERYSPRQVREASSRQRPTEELPTGELPYGFTVTYQNPSVSLGDAPHLNPDMDSNVLAFAVRHAVISAFRSVGLSTPLIVHLQKDSKPDKPLVYRSTWKLHHNDTYDDLRMESARLQELLGCAWLKTHRSVTHRCAILAIGASAPDQDLLAEHASRAYESYGWISQPAEELATA